MNKELINKRILVTSTSFGKVDTGLKSSLEAAVGEVIYNPFGRPLTASELIPLMAEIDGFIAGVDEIDADVIQAAVGLKVISRYGTGTDRVDIDAATQKGIVVTNTPGANAVAVAELAIGFMLSLARNLCQANQSTHQGEWSRYSGISFREKTVGLVGLGFIGREVAKRLKSFGCRLLATDPVVEPEVAKAIDVELTSLEDLLSRSHFVSLHLPATASTTGMINRETLTQMKPGAFLINTARGELIDETALEEALTSEHLGGAALDVFSKEPPGKDNNLLQLPQVVLTPHMASRTDDAMNQMGRIAMQDCLAVLRGERPQHAVNPHVYGDEKS